MTDWKDYSQYIEQANEHTIDNKQIKMFTRLNLPPGTRY